MIEKVEHVARAMPVVLSILIVPTKVKPRIRKFNFRKNF